MQKKRTLISDGETKLKILFLPGAPITLIERIGRVHYFADKFGFIYVFFDTGRQMSTIGNPKA